jgi:hypothetical protein
VHDSDVLAINIYTMKTTITNAVILVLQLWSLLTRRLIGAFETEISVYSGVLNLKQVHSRRGKVVSVLKLLWGLEMNAGLSNITITIWNWISLVGNYPLIKHDLHEWENYFTVNTRHWT